MCIDLCFFPNLFITNRAESCVKAGNRLLNMAYLKVVGPVFLVTTLLNRYSSYIPPVDFTMIKWMKAPIQGFEKILDVLELLRKN